MGMYNVPTPLRRCGNLAASAHLTTRAGALWGAGFVLTIIADERAENYLRDGLAMARRTGDGSLVARPLDVLGLLAFFGNELATAQSQLEESIRHARAAGDDWCLADALGTIGSIYPLVGKLDQGRVAAAVEPRRRCARTRAGRA
jgi:hypothetical protein